MRERIQLDSTVAAVVVDCDQLPGAWMAMFMDPDEAARYAEWRRTVPGVDGGVVVAATALHIDAGEADGLQIINDETCVVGYGDTNE